LKPENVLLKMDSTAAIGVVAKITCVLLSPACPAADDLHLMLVCVNLMPMHWLCMLRPALPVSCRDFGLSTTIGPQATHVSNYNSGTPFYVAPEVRLHAHVQPQPVLPFPGLLCCTGGV
jgi:serine/threonine protein kinase